MEIKTARVIDLSIEEVRIKANNLLEQISNGTNPQLEKDKINFTEN
ncbi:MAG: hypothetical protein IPN13_00555 [Bacteroidetes bacterium]|nr:hypothetical protein [Bacteroidota bacterium]